ncbi:hypothetical protein [Pseudomonas sp. N040]|uniref:hypothetical protein n=1 Tax=Pseudomonas sp. N040 TaxID=2785325 RepID=UPI0018A254FE|nr:hypothetical protein [Pseudomonas sp. N040]MBF7731163.1 hypothetical protein [Pseudomonas sp. N040]MBW7014806.1 hypothetical protein [Pseudomonas sp. N040]
MKKRILVIARSYPNVSHSYIDNDVRFLDERADVLVLSRKQPTAPYYSAVEFNYFDNLNQLELQARLFKPDMIICWMLPHHFYARQIAESLNIPFILKLHTPDVFRLIKGPASIKQEIKAFMSGEDVLSGSYKVLMSSLKRTAQSKWLKGVFCIPALQQSFAEYFPKGLLRNMQPWIDFETFHNDSPNGDNVLVLGSLVNRRENQVTFSNFINQIDAQVDWIPVPTPGCLWLDVPGIPDNVHIRKFLPPTQMPALYKTYKAMLVIGAGEFGRGLPMSVLEAQAAGVTVIAPSLRPDFDAFVTAGGGFIFQSESEIPGLLARAQEPARRNMGFEHAAQYGPESFSRALASLGLELG